PHPLARARAFPAGLLVAHERVTSGDAAWSAASGVAVGLGLATFYTAMTRGLISLVAPVPAVVGALAPVVSALAGGERPGVLATVGIVLAVAAIALISLVPA